MLCRREIFGGLLLFVCLFVQVSRADDPITLVPEPMELTSAPVGEGWIRWDGIGNSGGVMSYRERITALAADDAQLWVGTSWGRLLHRADDRWRLIGKLQGLEITGVAVDGADKLWLSTSDGICRLDRKQESDAWEVTRFLIYYQGHPAFVSGAYMPGEDASRRWGYVDEIFVSAKEKSYSPYAISNEHGLFSWGGYGRVWHHYLPHYTGANSAWLDIRELLPHRRPTCMVEDKESNLWIGSEWDGLVRMNAAGRRYAYRDPENNEKDGSEFSSFKAKELGVEFDRVEDLAASQQSGIWAIVSSREGGSYLARYDGERWSTFQVSEKAELTSVVEVKPGEVLVGTGGSRQRRGLARVNWQAREVTPEPGIDQQVLESVRLQDGRVVAASWWSLYEEK